MGRGAAIDTFGADFAKLVTRRHIEAAHAGGPAERPEYLLSLARSLEKTAPKLHAGTLRLVNELWLGGVKQLDSTLAGFQKLGGVKS